VATAPLGILGLGDSVFVWRSALAVVALGSLGTGLAFVLMASNAGSYGSTRASSTTYLIPGVALALGLVFRAESVALLAIIGSVVALAGAYLVNTVVRPTK
jgi:drug/metabolite transporter (DMT)-like permease